MNLNDESVWRFDPGPGWIVQEIVANEGEAVAVVSNDSTLQARIVALGDSTQSPNELWSAKGFIPDLSVADGDFFQTVLDADGLFCVSKLANPEHLFCDPDNRIGRLGANESTLSWIAIRPDSECVALQRWSLNDSAEPEAVQTPADHCVFAGAAKEDLAGWSLVPEPDASGYIDYSAVDLYGSTGAETISLGVGSAGSMTICNESLVWEHTRPDGTNELRVWRGSGEPETIYISPDSGEGKRYSTSKPFCTNDQQVYFNRIGWQVGAPSEVLIAGPFDYEIGPTIESDPVARDTPVAPNLTDELADWASSYTSLEIKEFAGIICDEIEQIDPDERVAYIWNDNTSTRWTQMMGLSDNELYPFRQFAASTQCPEHLPLVTGN